MSRETFVLELLVACVGGAICGMLVDVWIYIFQRISLEFRKDEERVGAMSRQWKIGDIVEKHYEASGRDNFVMRRTAMVTAVEVLSSDLYDEFRRLSLGPWYEGKTQAQLEEMGWKLVDGEPLIPPGTQTHQFTDIPDDDLLTPREGHPYT